MSEEYLRFLSKPGHIEIRIPIDRKKQEMDFPGFTVNSVTMETKLLAKRSSQCSQRQRNFKKWEPLRL